jgi:hypothetical protein
VAGTDSPEAAIADAIHQLKTAPESQTLFRSFPYASGAAYGLLLDAWSPGWPRRIKVSDDLGKLLVKAAQLRPTEDLNAATQRYDGSELKRAEEKRDAQQKLRVSELRRKLVDGPVLIIPPARTAAFMTNGMTPIPGTGTVYPTYRASDNWGSLEGNTVLVLSDSRNLVVQAPFAVDGSRAKGTGWTLDIATGWSIRKGKRSGDFELLQNQAESAQAQTNREHIIELAANIRRADYEGDRAALGRLRDQLPESVEDKLTEARIRYWRGFALWRKAINGFNDNIAPNELLADLTAARAEFAKSADADPAFLDAKIGTASCLSMSIGLSTADPARMRELITTLNPLLKELQASAPENPRLLWVLGLNLWRLPAERGGGETKSIATYEKGLELARKQAATTTDPLTPSWGEPENLMSLAWAQLNRANPDVNAAERYARAALQIVPYWHYVRDILLKQILETKQK